MKTKHFLVLSLILATAITTLQAQVRIGDLSAPRKGVSLDLNGENNTAKTGLGLPIVELVNSGSALPLADDFSTLRGVMVYNLTVDEGAGLPIAGIYVAGASNWVQLIVSGKTEEYADIVLLTGLPSKVWLGTTGAFSKKLTVTTTIDNTEGIQLKYQWYYVASGENQIPVTITDSINNTFTILAGSDADYKLQSPGDVKKYFCVVRNGVKSTVTTRVCAVYGSGVFLDNDVWLNMLSYNLGVTDEGKSLTPQEQYDKCLANFEDPSVTGYLYQWGRASDGHESRSSSNYDAVKSATAGVDVAANGQVALGSPGYGQFILRNTGSPYDWRNLADITEWDKAYDPCIAARTEGGKEWRLPTSEEWAQIYHNNNPDITNKKGLRFRPDDTGNVSVFLPAAGNRNRANGALPLEGTSGYYWSSTPSGANAFGLGFYGGTVSPTGTNNRSHGFSVRCVAF
jgi:uncharacterized protein (TIGR02145 family)